MVISVYLSYLGLIGAVTGLEDRHSMALQGFFNSLGQDGFYENKGAIVIIVQTDVHDLVDIVFSQLELYGFQIHDLSLIFIGSFR